MHIVSFLLETRAADLRRNCYFWASPGYCCIETCFSVFFAWWTNPWHSAFKKVDETWRPVQFPRPRLFFIKMNVADAKMHKKNYVKQTAWITCRMQQKKMSIQRRKYLALNFFASWWKNVNQVIYKNVYKFCVYTAGLRFEVHRKPHISRY